MPAEAKSITAQSLETSVEHLASLAVAAILFTFGILLSGLPHPTAAVTPSAINFTALLQQFIAGILFVAAIVMAFLKQRLGFSISVVFENAKAVAVGSILFTTGMTFLGLGSQLQASQPLEAAILDIIGGILVLLSIVLGGTLGLIAGQSASK